METWTQFENAWAYMSVLKGLTHKKKRKRERKREQESEREERMIMFYIVRFSITVFDHFVCFTKNKNCTLGMMFVSSFVLFCPRYFFSFKFYIKNGGTQN